MDAEQVAHLGGRVLFSWLFLLSGFRHLTQTKGLAEYAQAVGKVPMPTVAVVVTGLMMLAGGLCILVGWHPRIGAALIFAFVLPTAFIMHGFWGIADPMQRANQEAHFWKNITIAGAALYLAANPNWPWPWSLGL